MDSRHHAGRSASGSASSATWASASTGSTGRIKSAHQGVLTGRRRGRKVDEATSGRCATSRSASSRGEAVGLVGGNGQGKSHPAQAHRRRAAARRGRITVRGGVAPLIEVTGGFVGDLTARDNIWLTAGLHGLSKSADRGAVRRDRRLRRGRRLPRHPVPALLLGHEGAARVLGDHHPRRADRARRRGAGGRRPGLPREVLRAHGGTALRRPDAVPGLAQRGRPAPVLHPRALPAEAARWSPTAPSTRRSTPTTAITTGVARSLTGS